jgi:YD repeat-containing protein
MSLRRNGYNAVNRRISISQNGTDRYIFQYDPNGNTTQEVDKSKNQVTTEQHLGGNQKSEWW